MKRSNQPFLGKHENLPNRPPLTPPKFDGTFALMILFCNDKIADDGAGMEEHFAEFIERIQAASGTLTAEYFQLPVAEGDAVYRERVYCYELYHCMRRDWGDFPFSLGGEIDKSGHPFFREGPYAQAKPDFLVHQPGSMDANLACVEVKSSVQAIEALVNDLRKLVWFRDHARYFGGILLVFGEDHRIVRELGRDLRSAAAAANLNLSGITILRHREVGTRPLVL